jgi:hypothetical protein
VIKWPLLLFFANTVHMQSEATVQLLEATKRPLLLLFANAAHIGLCMTLHK